MTTLSITEVAREIMKSAAPVLFPDTCSLVDLIRLPIRNNEPAKVLRTLNAAQEILAAARQTPRKAWIVIAPPIPIEWAEHSVATTENLSVELRRIDELLEVLHTLEPIAKFPLGSRISYSDLEIGAGLSNISQNFLLSGIEIQSDHDSTVKASFREISKTPPAAKGGAHKDCMIVEHVIAVCRELDNHSFAANKVFLTSNTHDFCEPGSRSTLQATLAEEFESVGLEFTLTWEWARQKMGL